MGEKAKKKNGKRTIPIFYIVYFTLIIVFLIALFFALKAIKIKLAEYEASRPYHVADAVMEEYFKPGDAEKLMEASGYVANEYEDASVPVGVVEGFLAGDPQYYAVASSSDEQKYAVSSGELKFATFTIAPSGERDAADYDIWKLRSVELLIAGGESVRITAPGDAVVYLNGRQMTDAEKVETVTHERDGHLPEEIPPETSVVYEVKGLIEKPKITAQDRYGADITEITEKDNSYTVPKTYAEMTDEVRDLALAAGEQFAAYTQLDAAFWAIGQYVDPSSDLYSNLLHTDVIWADPHNGYSIENPSVTEYTVYSDSLYSVRVKFLHVLYNWGGNFENEFDTTFYYRWNGEKWLIYDSQVN